MVIILYYRCVMNKINKNEYSPKFFFLALDDKNCKVQLYWSLYNIIQTKSIITYARHTWPITLKVEIKLAIIERKFLRKICEPKLK